MLLLRFDRTFDGWLLCVGRVNQRIPGSQYPDPESIFMEVTGLWNTPVSNKYDWVDTRELSF